MLNGLQMTGQMPYNKELAINECYLGEGSTLKSLDLKVCEDGVDVGSESEFAVVIENGNNKNCTMTIKGKIAFMQIVISEIKRVWGIKLFLVPVPMVCIPMVCNMYTYGM